jgi:hypothetical protein
VQARAKFEPVVNLKTARALARIVSPQLLARALMLCARLEKFRRIGFCDRAADYASLIRPTGQEAAVTWRICP